MQGLGETVASLRRFRGSKSAAEGQTRPGQPLSETLEFGANPGALRMFSYRPERLAPNAPLVVLLHGCTQTAASYAVDSGWMALADRCRFMVLAPEQTAANNPNRCFNWFLSEDTTRGGGEAASIAQMVDHCLRAEQIDSSRVFITGLSAGGAMTSAMLACYPDLFAAGAILAGLPHGVARSMLEALRVMQRPDGRSAAELGRLVPPIAPGCNHPRISVWHGDADHVVNPSNASDIVDQWTEALGIQAVVPDVEALPGRTRTVWRSPHGGAVMIESNLIRGMGHGTPLATRESGAVGSAAPFMLDVGISSTREIAAFWGLTDPLSQDGFNAARAASRPPEVSFLDATADAENPPDIHDPAGVEAIGDKVMQSLTRLVPPNVQDVIAKALKSAGLMK
jgi:feruloyl esterase